MLALRDMLNPRFFLSRQCSLFDSKLYGVQFNCAECLRNDVEVYSIFFSLKLTPLIIACNSSSPLTVILSPSSSSSAMLNFQFYFVGSPRLLAFQLFQRANALL